MRASGVSLARAIRRMPFVPQPIRIHRAGRHVEHAVVLAEHVDPAAGLADAIQLGDDSSRLGDRLSHVAAHDQIELTIAELQLERVALFEAHPSASACVRSPCVKLRSFPEYPRRRFEPEDIGRPGGW